MSLATGLSEVRVAPELLRGYVAAIFTASGSSGSEAAIVADHLVDANLLGHDSHGVIRVAKYMDWLADGLVIANRHAEVVNDRGPLLFVEGGFGYGQVIGREAMAIAADRARSYGMAALAIRNAGHLGRIGAWPEPLAAAGLVSVHYVNTSGFGILVAPHGGSDRRLSANPIAAGVPVPGRAPLVLDIATSAMAEGRIQVARNRGAPIPAGYLLDGKGRPTTDPAAFYADPPGAILPFGDHKGSGLSFFCEVLAGSLSGGGSSHPENPTARRLVNNMLSLAFDPAAFGEGGVFAADIERLIDWVKASPPAVAGGEVLLPGEIEQRAREERQKAGVPLDAETRRQLIGAGSRFGVPVPLELGG
jgi:uncharacterized oxidoreductase